ncbi:hypothetical protein FOCC_FOCC012264 [Frankliniella occidentalis]|nr:hypothetical protein FOCC_FOCC012264 [Frankliniella occidentalis]
MDKKPNRKVSAPTRGGALLRMCNIEPPEPPKLREDKVTQPKKKQSNGCQPNSPIKDDDLDILNEHWKGDTPRKCSSVQSLSPLHASCSEGRKDKENKTQESRESTAGATRGNCVQSLSGLSKQSCSENLKGKENRKSTDNNLPHSLGLKTDKGLQENEKHEKHGIHERKSNTTSEKANNFVYFIPDADKRRMPERQSRNKPVKRCLLDELLSASETEEDDASSEPAEEENDEVPLQVGPPKQLTPYQMLRLNNLAANAKALLEIQSSQTNEVSDTLPSTSGRKRGCHTAKQDAKTSPLSVSDSPDGATRKHGSKRKTASSTKRARHDSDSSFHLESEDESSGDESLKSSLSQLNHQDDGKDDSGDEMRPPSLNSQQNQDKDDSSHEEGRSSPLPDQNNQDGDGNENPDSPNSLNVLEYNISDMEPEENSPVKMTARQAREDRKEKRNVGDAYISSKGKHMRERSRKPPHTCTTNYCQDIIDDDTGENLFVEFWEMGCQERRVQYVAARIESGPIARHRNRDEDSGRKKSASHKYFFEIGGKRVRVCKGTFLRTLDISDTFVTNVINKKADTISGIARNDRRGKKAPPHKMSHDKRALVLRHINSFPCYVSHYCRKDTSQKYLPNSLNLTKMHKLYLETHPDPKDNVSYASYQRIFKPLKIKFHQRLSDTCNKCDMLVAKIKHATEDKAQLQKEHELHLRKAEKAYKLKQEVKQKAESDETMRVLIFDLEQCLPCPDLNCGTVYYKRQLYTFNLTIYDTTSKLLHCYMWHEAEGMRGANEIASCLFEHIKTEIPPGVTELYLFSDCCSGQNRNSIISAMFHVALQMHPSIKVINHIFLIPGHTRMECDAKHAVIERAKRKEDVINVPSEYYKLVEKAGMADVNFPEGKFKVVPMASKLYDFAVLLKKPNPLIKRKVTTEKNPFGYMQTHWFKYDKKNLGITMVKTAFNTNAPFEELSFLRHRKNSLPELSSLLKLSHEGPVPISVKKKEDLLALLPFIDPCHHAFYQNLTTDASIQDTHPDAPNELHPDDDSLEETD